VAFCQDGPISWVAVARSLVLDPDLILFDEPTTGLDPIVGHPVNELIRNLNRHAAVTILVVTHDLHTAFYLASRIAMLNERQNCRIRFTGSDQEIS